MDLIIKRLHSFNEYQKHRLLIDSVYRHCRGYEAGLQENNHGAFEVTGFSHPAGVRIIFWLIFIRHRNINELSE